MGNVSLKSGRSILIPGILSLILFLAICSCNNTEPKKSSENLPSTAATEITEDQEQTLSVDPEAVELFRNAMDYLRNLKQFSVEAQSTYEDILESGHRVDYEISSDVIVSRPNKLHTERHGNMFDQIFYYNGKVLTLYNPSDKVYATEPTPGTLGEMFHFARDTFGISNPVSDLLYSDAFALMMHDVNFGVVLGKEMIGKVHCNHLLFSRPGVDFQIWIAAEGPPLPFKYIVTDTGTPELLSFITVMRNWNTSPTISDDIFNFIPPQGTQKIEFLKAE